jgi:hypothetical protein
MACRDRRRNPGLRPRFATRRDNAVERFDPTLPTRRRRQIPVERAAPSVLHPPRFRALALFRRRPPVRLDQFVIPASEFRMRPDQNRPFRLRARTGRERPGTRKPIARSVPFVFPPDCASPGVTLSPCRVTAPAVVVRPATKLSKPGRWPGRLLNALIGSKKQRFRGGKESRSGTNCGTSGRSHHGSHGIRHTGPKPRRTSEQVRPCSERRQQPGRR